MKKLIILAVLALAMAAGSMAMTTFGAPRAPQATACGIDYC
jgi:hypothetical protein